MRVGLKRRGLKLSASTNIRREIKDMMMVGGGKREEKTHRRIRDRKRDRVTNLKRLKKIKSPNTKYR